MGLLCCVCLWLLLALALLGASAWQCPRIPYSSTRNFSIPYTLPSLDAGSPIQNVAVFTNSDGPVAAFVAVRNRILLVSPELRLLSVLVTGPVGSAKCEICRLCPATTDGPEDTDNVLLLLDPLEPWLYSCGTAQHGLCYQHQLEVRDGKVAIIATHCLYSATGNSPAFCPDCVVSPLGTSATVVATSYASVFYLGSTIDSSVAARYSPQSVSIRRLKGTLDGFSNDFQWLTVLPQYRDNYTIHYVHSFANGDHVYFLMVQPERPGSAVYHTRLARLSTHERHLRRYRELVLDCRFESKRRRRRSGEEDAERDIAYNVLQAAHAARPGARLARDLGINDTDTVLFGAFAESHPESPLPQENSAVCAFPLRLLNQAMEEGMKKCCGTGHQPLLRGLSFFQPVEYCPHNVNLSAPVVNTSCWDQPTLVPAASHKVDLFNGQLTGVLLTSLFVTAMGDVTVAHLGTAEGRVFQMVLQRSSSYLLTLSNFSLGEPGPVRGAVGLQSRLLFFTAGTKVWLLNVTGPGCRHFSTCQRCLRAERFMGCGWCGDGCRRHHECPGHWVQDSCPPVLTDFHPRSAPLRGRTRVTLCGMTFRSRLDPDPGRSPRDACRVAVGQRSCTVLPEESESFRPLPTSRRKEFVDVLVCELEPGGPAALGGPADVVLTVEEPARASGFRVYGSATLGGFVFVEPHVRALHPPFGPRGGGTHLSLHGKHLSAGSSWRVMVNGSECALTGQPRQDNGTIQCTAPAAGGLGAARVALWIDGQEFPAPVPFQYRPDPAVSAIVPSCSYEGSLLTIIGTHLDSVYRAKIRFEAAGVTTQATECKNPLAPDRLLCHSPAFPFESNVEVVLGNLSVLLDGADGRWLFRLRYYSRPKVYPLEQEGRRLRLKPGEDEIEVHQLGLDAVATCMNITMTVGGLDCRPSVLKNEVTCRLPRELRLPPAGAPVEVGTPRGATTRPRPPHPIPAEPLILQICVNGACEALGWVLSPPIAGPGRQPGSGHRHHLPALLHPGCRAVPLALEEEAGYGEPGAAGTARPQRPARHHPAPRRGLQRGAGAEHSGHSRPRGAPHTGHRRRCQWQCWGWCWCGGRGIPHAPAQGHILLPGGSAAGAAGGSEGHPHPRGAACHPPPPGHRQRALWQRLPWHLHGPSAGGPALRCQVPAPHHRPGGGGGVPARGHPHEELPPPAGALAAGGVPAPPRAAPCRPALHAPRGPAPVHPQPGAEPHNEGPHRLRAAGGPGHGVPGPEEVCASGPGSQELHAG
uniref:Uncharacterized protein n=1 Tax=Geospiza parvula TaxID=87175 RepID=A0A8C3MWS1_GEOPR